MEATTEQLNAFSRALESRLGQLSRRRLAELVMEHSGESVSQQAVSLWLLAQSEPSRRKVFAIEEVLALPPGTLSAHLGYLPTTARSNETVLGALERDTTLDKRSSRILAAAYREAVRDVAPIVS